MAQACRVSCTGSPHSSLPIHCSLLHLLGEQPTWSSLATSHHHINSPRNRPPVITNLIPLKASSLQKDLTATKRAPTARQSLLLSSESKRQQPLLFSTPKRTSLPSAADGTHPSHLERSSPATCPPLSTIQLRAWIPTWRMSGACLQTSPPPLLRSPPPFPRLMGGLKA